MVDLEGEGAEGKNKATKKNRAGVQQKKTSKAIGTRKQASKQASEEEKAQSSRVCRLCERTAAGNAQACSTPRLYYQLPTWPAASLLP